MPKPEKSAYVKERLAQVAAAAAQAAAAAASFVEPPKSEPKKAVPVFKPEGPFNLMSNGWRIQGKWYFSAAGEYCGDADPGLWLPELTPEQEQKRQADIARQKAKAALLARPARGAPPPVPQKVIDNARENADALRAEAFAE